MGAFCPFCGAPREQEEVLTPEQPLKEMVEEQPEALEEFPEEIQEITEEAAEESAEKAEGEVQETLQPRRKLKLWQLIAMIAGGVVLLSILAGAILYGLGITPAEVWNAMKPRENNVAYKDSYTAEDEEIEKKADTVIATLADKALTLGQLQLYYTNDIYTFYSQYYSYIAYFGLDLSQPLDEQSNPMTQDGQTWQQYFLETALTSWQSYALLDILVAENGYTPSEELQAELDSMEENITAMAQSYGYADAQEYLDAELAPGVSMEDYLAFNRSYYIGNEYLDHCYQELYPQQAEIDAYYQENQATFADSGVEPDMGLQSSVRHILIQPEGGTEDESGTVTYSDEEKAAAYAEAERILEEWKSGAATEESFGELANTYSKDGGSNTTGGLYEKVNIDASYVEPFRSWAVDATRKIGDTAIVETDFGYHIMYFVSGEDYFTYQVAEQLIAQRIQDMLKAAQEVHPMEVNYKKILLHTPKFG